MKNRTLVWLPGTALAGLLALGGCGKAPEPAGVPAPTTTVGSVIDDSVVTAAVKSAFLADAEVKGFELKVATRKGEVQSSGFVDSQAQVDRAIVVARGAEGVSTVANNMSIKK